MGGRQHPPVIDETAGDGPVVLVCEHASNAFPQPWGTLGLTAAQQTAHVAWDLGALWLARALALRLQAALVHATVSRLIQDCNRAPHQPGAMPVRSELHDIPGNTSLTPADRAARTEAVYLPFHAGLQALLMRRLALGQPTVLLTIHSFTPVYFGQARALEFGVIHDADPRLAEATVAAARAGTPLKCALNAPYSAADDVTHTLRLHATAYGLFNAMLELRNDLIATPDAAEAMAGLLAPILQAAVDACLQPGSAA